MAKKRMKRRSSANELIAADNMAQEAVKAAVSNAEPKIDPIPVEPKKVAEKPPEKPPVKVEEAPVPKFTELEIQLCKLRKAGKISKEAMGLKLHVPRKDVVALIAKYNLS